MPKTPAGPKTKHAPTTKDSKDASNQLRKGHSSAGRAMAAKSKATGKRR
jgi:hypothetical protein